MGWRRHTGQWLAGTPRLWLWRGAARVSGAAGLVCAFVVWGLGDPTATALGLMVPTLAVSVLTGIHSIRWSIGIALGVSASVVAIAGILAAFGWSGAAWLGFLVVTSPIVRVVLLSGRLWAVPGSPVGCDTALLRGESEPAEDHRGPLEDPTAGMLKTPLISLPELPDADVLTALDDRAICVAWRRSYLQLAEVTPTGGRLEVVRLRQLYLDELSRRHPAELRRWLASGARAAGNPLPFLERPPCTHPAEDPPADE